MHHSGGACSVKKKTLNVVVLNDVSCVSPFHYGSEVCVVRRPAVELWPHFFFFFFLLSLSRKASKPYAKTQKIKFVYLFVGSN